MNQLDFDAGRTLQAARPSEMVVILYEETLRSLDRAVDAVEHGDLAARNRHAARAADIIDLLDGCLDMQRGGDVAANLAGLYRMVMGRLVQFNASRDGSAGREAISLLAPLRDAWKSVDRDAEQAAAAA